MNFIDYKGAKIAYRQKGQGMPLVFLHGFCGDSRIWDEFTETWSEDYQLVDLDLPGFGQSELVKNYTIDELATIVKLLLDRLNISSCILLGHSMGGYVSLAFAKKYGNLLKGLGLLHAHPYADDTETKQKRQKGISFLRRNGHITYIKQFMPALVAPQAVGSMSFELEKLTYRGLEYSSDAIIAGLEAMSARTDTSAVLEDINCPVLFLIGTDDQAIPAAYSRAQTCLPSIADIQILKGVGHLGMVERKQQSQRIVRNFIHFCTER